MNKKVTFEAILDNSHFNAEMDKITKKFEVMQRQQSTAQRLEKQGPNNLMSSVSMEAFNRATQASKREMDQLISSQAKSQEKLGKSIAQRTEMLKKLQEQQKDINKSAEEEIRLKERIGKVEANNQRLRESYITRDQNLNQLMDARQNAGNKGIDGIMDAYRSGGMRGAAGAAAQGNRFGAIGVGASVIGGIAGAAGAVGSYAEQFTGYGQRLQEARGSAIEGTAGQNLRDVYSGRSPFEAAWMKERESAAGLASQKEGRNRVTDRLKGVGSIGGILGGAGLIGAGLVTGGASLLGMPFTAGGSAIGLPAAGAMIGSGAAAFGAGAYGMANDRTRQSINPFGQKEYDQLLAKNQAVDFRQNYENLKNQDPGKKLALEDFEQNRERNVRAQRQLGLSNNQFYKGGGFLADVQQGGFMAEQGIGMANQIVGAGGSARMGQNAKFGLQMERAGLTNASGILGTMSGSIQNPEANKRATIAIMSEAFKIGLDNTDFAEENRRFSQAAANIIGKTGVTSETDQERLTGILSQFMAQKTNSGVQEAQTAYEKYQERGSQTSGRRGTLRFAEAMKDKDLSKMNTSDLTELLSMRPDQMNASNPAMAEFARSAGIPVDQLVEKMTGKGGINAAGRFTFPGQQKKIGEASEKINQYMKESGNSWSDIGDMSRKGTLPVNIQQALGRAMIEANKSESGGLTAGGGLATVGEFIESQARPGDMKGKALKDLNEGPGRVEDQFNKQAAAGAEEARKNFNQMTEELWKAVAGAEAFTKAMAPVSGVLGSAANTNKSSLPQGQGSNLDIITNFSNGAVLQPNANKPKGN